LFHTVAVLGLQHPEGSPRLRLALSSREMGHRDTRDTPPPAHPVIRGGRDAAGRAAGAAGGGRLKGVGKGSSSRIARPDTRQRRGGFVAKGNKGNKGNSSDVKGGKGSDAKGNKGKSSDVKGGKGSEEDDKDDEDGPDTDSGMSDGKGGGSSGPGGGGGKGGGPNDIGGGGGILA
jgi:hypothetical protein